jgi:cytochrome c553
MVRAVAVIVLAISGVAVRPAVAVAQDAPRAQVTYAKDIAPILQRSCTTCHNPTGIGPIRPGGVRSLRAMSG